FAAVAEPRICDRSRPRPDWLSIRKRLPTHSGTDVSPSHGVLARYAEMRPGVHGAGRGGGCHLLRPCAGLVIYLAIDKWRTSRTLPTGRTMVWMPRMSFAIYS